MTTPTPTYPTTVTIEGQTFDLKHMTAEEGEKIYALLPPEGKKKADYVKSVVTAFRSVAEVAEKNNTTVAKIIASVKGYVGNAASHTDIEVPAEIKELGAELEKQGLTLDNLVDFMGMKPLVDAGKGAASAAETVYGVVDAGANVVDGTIYGPGRLFNLLVASGEYAIDAVTPDFGGPDDSDAKAFGAAVAAIEYDIRQKRVGQPAEWSNLPDRAVAGAEWGFEWVVKNIPGVEWIVAGVMAGWEYCFNNEQNKDFSQLFADARAELAAKPAVDQARYEQLRNEQYAGGDISKEVEARLLAMDEVAGIKTAPVAALVAPNETPELNTPDGVVQYSLDKPPVTVSTPGGELQESWDAFASNPYAAGSGILATVGLAKGGLREATASVSAVKAGSALDKTIEWANKPVARLNIPGWIGDKVGASGAWAFRKTGEVASGVVVNTARLGINSTAFVAEKAAATAAKAASAVDGTVAAVEKTTAAIAAKGAEEGAGWFSRALGYLAKGVKAVPLVGGLITSGEMAFVGYWGNLDDDHDAGKIDDAEYTAYRSLQVAYGASGAGGFIGLGIAEGVLDTLKASGFKNAERYLPPGLLGMVYDGMQPDENSCEASTMSMIASPLIAMAQVKQCEDKKAEQAEADAQAQANWERMKREGISQQEYDAIMNNGLMPKIARDMYKKILDDNHIQIRATSVSMGAVVPADQIGALPTPSNPTADQAVAAIAGSGKVVDPSTLSVS